jgi:hypothetical protein
MKRFLSYLLLVTSVPLALGDLEGRQPKSLAGADLSL